MPNCRCHSTKGWINMYCTSKLFLDKMRGYIAVIEEKSKGTLRFEEYIPLPHFGKTILRFNLERDNYTLADIDAYEAWMQEIVNDEFLVDFMGSVYQKVGLESRMFEEKFRKCYDAYKNVTITARDYRKMLNQDAAFLLNECGLPTSAKVWEIQIDDDLALYILGKENRKIGTYPLGDKRIHIFEVDEIPCIGLMRAITYAASKHISLVHALMEI